MNKAFEALDQIAKKVGIVAALFAGYLYMTVVDLQEKVDKLDRTTADLAELKTDVAAINAKLSIILTDYSKLK